MATENIPGLWRSKLPRPAAEGNKYARGHLIVFGGAKLTGAARLASEAAMRIGAGLCTIVADEHAGVVYRRDGAPHVMFEAFSGNAAAHLADERRNVALIGPGAGRDDDAALRAAVLSLLETGKPVVLDADALSCFEGHETELYEALHANCLLTPHEGEFKRIFPTLTGDKISRAENAAHMSGSVVLLKGADTVIAASGCDTVLNLHATPFLATAGAGDVLAGMIGGLIAQGMGAYSAACAAAWMHGEAAMQKGPGLVAPDLIEKIPDVLKSVL